eukprot:gene8384-96_t
MAQNAYAGTRRTVLGSGDPDPKRSKAQDPWADRLRKVYQGASQTVFPKCPNLNKVKGHYPHTYLALADLPTHLTSLEIEHAWTFPNLAEYKRNAEAKAIAAQNSSKGKKKKWSKGKQKEKKAQYEKLLAEVPKYKMISQSVLSDRLRIGGSLARAAIKDLEAKGLIKPLVKHSKQLVYTRATGA